MSYNSMPQLHVHTRYYYYTEKIVLKLHEISSCMTEVTSPDIAVLVFNMVMYCSSAKACNVQLLVTITCYACTSLNLLLHAESMEVILASNLPDLHGAYKH